MFKYKTGAEIEAMTATERDAYAVAKRKFEEDNRNKAISDAVDEATKDLPKAKTAAETKVEVDAIIKANTEIVDANKSIGELRAEIAALKDAGGNGGEIESPMLKSIKENKVALLNLANKTSVKEVVIKTLANRASIANNEQAFDLPDIGQLATRKLSLYDICPKVTISESNNNGVVRYYDWDQTSITRAAAAVAEGATFPESKVAWTMKTINVQKIGDTLPVTAEFMEDEAMFAAEIGLFLETNVALEVDRQLWAGDGTANQMVGFVSSISATSTYVPTAQGIADATIYDLIIVLKAAITLNGGSKYTPNFVLMNVIDINKMRLAKDANHNYILPPFVSQNGDNISGIVVIESNIVTANTLVLGDNRFMRIYEKTGVEITQGLVNAQFTADEWTLKARKRMCFLIRYADTSGFMYVADIAGAVTTIGT